MAQSMQPTRSSRYQVSSVSPLGAQDFFGPGQPQWPYGPPGQIGRTLDYPVGENIRIQPRQQESLTYFDLVQLADNHDVTRLLIETRKDQMEGLESHIRPKGSTGKKGLNAHQQHRIDATEDLLRNPDGQNTFETWQRMILEQCLVIDATSIYIDRSEPETGTKFRPIDGATIKRVIDGRGNTPLPPDPAYQQIIKGMPAWDYSTDELIYFPRNKRVSRLYGCSPVQQLYITINMALRRQASVLEYFSEGNIPDAFATVPDSWNSQQIVDAQMAFDSLYSGNTAMRRHMKFLPGGTKYYPTKEITLKTEFDEWLARIACFAFSISPSWLAKSTNRASAQTIAEAAVIEGLLPLMRWFRSLMNYIIQHPSCLNQHDLEWAWDEWDDADPDVRDKILDRKIRRGQISINEGRAADGDDPTPGGDVPMIYMGSGPIPVKLAAAQKTLPGAAPPGGPPGSKPIQGPAPKPNGRPDNLGAPQKRPPNQKGAALEGQDPFSVTKLPSFGQIFNEAEIKVQNTLSDVLEEMRSKVATHIERAVSGSITRADEKPPKPGPLPNLEGIPAEDVAVFEAAYEAITTADLDGFEAVIDPIADALLSVGQDALSQAVIAVISVEMDGAGVIANANPKVIAFAERRAAELVGKRILADGTLVDNPNAKWSITQATRNMLRDTIRNSFESGLGIRGLAKEIENAYEFSHERAMTIARTECLPPDTLVDGAVIRAVFRRWYEGDLIKIKTCDGRSFSATPNHPMFTKRGWIGAGQIKDGDYLICDLGQKNISQNSYVNNSPTTIGEIYNTLSTIGIMERNFCLPVDFHGDGQKGQINIFRSHRALPIGDFAPLFEPIVKSILSPSNMVRAPLCSFCGCLLAINQASCICDGAQNYSFFFQTISNLLNSRIKEITQRIKRFPSKISLFNYITRQIMAELVMLTPKFIEEFASSTAASHNPSFPYAGGDTIYSNSKLFGNLNNAHTTQVKLDMVQSISVTRYEGHIFNLETPFGYFTISNGLFTGNTIMAHNQGALAGYVTAKAAGVPMQKSWLTASGCCDVCEANEKQGAIELEEAFQSGDDAPPGHPNCRCTLLPVISKTEKADYYDAEQPYTVHDRDQPRGAHDAHQAHTDFDEEFHYHEEGDPNFTPSGRDARREQPFRPGRGVPRHSGRNRRRQRPELELDGASIGSRRQTLKE